MQTDAADSADRLGVTLLFSLILHSVLILGVTFEFEMPSPSLPTLDVTLVRTANSETPDKADFLAQANNTGGGDSDTAQRPSQLFSSPAPKPDPGVAPRPLNPSAPKPQTASGPEVLTQTRSTQTTPSDPEQRAQARRNLRESEADIRRRMKMAHLAAEIRESKSEYAKRPRKKFVSANTKEYAYAAYVSAWVQRIQRIGNLNYPDAARQDSLHGQLVLTVALRRDGSVKSMDIVQASGHQVLDDAALRIVELAAPFPPIPEQSAYDELYITNTWQFLPGDILRGR